MKAESVTPYTELSRDELEKRLRAAELELAKSRDQPTATVILTLRQRLMDERKARFELEDELQQFRSSSVSVPQSLDALQDSTDALSKDAYAEILETFFVPGQRILLTLQKRLRQLEELDDVIDSYTQVLWWLSRKHSKIVQGKTEKLFSLAKKKQEEIVHRKLPAQKRRTERDASILHRKATSFLQEQKKTDAQFAKKLNRLEHAAQVLQEKSTTLSDSTLQDIERFVKWVKELSVGEKRYLAEDSRTNFTRTEK